MNILKENQNEQVQILSIEICEADYAEKVLKSLKQQRRTAQIPGFRIGNAPMALIKKNYEKSFIADTVNDLMYEALQQHVTENKIQVLAEPLPINDRTIVDFEHPEKFVFTFEIAAKPEFSINYDQLPPVNHFQIVAAEEEIDRAITDLQKRYGQYTAPEQIADDDFITVEYGEKNNSNFYANNLNEEGKKCFIGKKIGEVVSVDVNTIFESDVKLAEFLKTNAELLDKSQPNVLNMNIKYIGHLEPAEMNEEFFQKISSETTPISNEAELRASEAAKIEAEYAQHVGQSFMNEAIETLVNNVQIELPTEFLKKFILARQPEMTAETLETEYPKYENSFKWELIEEKLVTENEIKIDEAAVRAYIRNFFITNYFSQINVAEVSDRIDSLVNETMQNKENLKQIYDQLFDQEVGKVLVSKMNLTEKKVTFKEFVEAVYGKKEKEETPKAKKTSKKATATEEPATEECEEKPKAKRTCKKKETPKAE